MKNHQIIQIDWFPYKIWTIILIQNEGMFVCMFEKT